MLLGSPRPPAAHRGRLIGRRGWFSLQKPGLRENESHSEIFCTEAACSCSFSSFMMSAFGHQRTHQELSLWHHAAPQLPHHRGRRQVPCRAHAAVLSPAMVQELVKVTQVAPSALTSTANTVAQVSQTFGGNALLFYWIMLGNSALAGTWMLHLAKFLWETVFERLIFHNQAEPARVERVLYGVDVTHSPFFERPEVLRAVDFAAEAHRGQRRKTGEPYVAHCIETACIVEALVDHAENTGLNDRAQSAILAALLHDVVDDTSITLADIHGEFGVEVATMVHKISQLSTMNQLLRRRRRQMSGSSRGIGLGREEETQLRSLILSMIDEPLVLVVKLADRLHNMRTVFALRQDRQKSVAAETLQLWCGLAERLGMMALKSEMEDLCFAVLQPKDYRSLRQQLDRLWGTQSFPDLSRVLEAAFGGGQQTERVIKQLAGRRESPQELALRVAYSSNAVNAAKLLAPRKVTMQQALDSAAKKPPMKMRPSRAAAARASGLLKETPVPPEHVTVGYGAFRAALKGTSDDSGATGGTAVLEAPRAPPQQEMLPLSRRPDMRASLARLVEPVSPADSAAPSSGANLAGQAAAPSVEHQPAASQAEPSVSSRQASHEAASSSGRSVQPDFSKLSGDQLQVRALVVSVLPFDRVGFKNPHNVPKYAEKGLKTLEACADTLLSELRIESVATGLNVRVEGRLKSLHSIYRKMHRKKIPLADVFDARALRVIVDDEHGTRMQEAIQACYRILTEAQRLWRKVPNEYDDYIANPKQSGYRSLHTCVKGPGGVPMEVQVRTSSMHATAEYGQAAHWAYKENTPKLLPPQTSVQEMQPVICVTDGNVRHGVVYSVDESKLQMLVAVSVAQQLPTPQFGSQETLRPYKDLHRHASDRKWWAPGHGDLRACLEAYASCKDGQWHRVDFTGTALKQSTCTPLEAWSGLCMTSSADIPAGEAADGQVPVPEAAQAALHLDQEQAMQIADKTLFLRNMLEFESEMSGKMAATSEVLILLWPSGEIVAVPRGTTAGQLERDQRWASLRGQASQQEPPPTKQFVNVNNTMVPADQELWDGDYLVVTNEILTI